MVFFAGSQSLWCNDGCCVQFLFFKVFIEMFAGSQFLWSNCLKESLNVLVVGAMMKMHEMLKIYYQNYYCLACYEMCI